MTYTLEDGSQVTDEFDMAVLSVGLEASPDAVALSCGIIQQRDGQIGDHRHIAHHHRRAPISVCIEPQMQKCDHDQPAVVGRAAEPPPIVRRPLIDADLAVF